MFTYAAYYDVNYVHFPKGLVRDSTDYGGKLRFLTFWDEILQAVFLWICFLNDLVGSNEVQLKPKSVIRRVKDFFHVTIGFPVGLFVAITFWGLYAVDRELILPKAIDPYFPTWLNHVVHTNVAIFTTLELITSFRVYPTRKRGLRALLLFMLTYLIWTFYIYSETGAWVYPILNLLNWPQRIVFFAVLLLFQMGLYTLGEFLNNQVWGKQIKRLESGEQSRRKTK